MPNLVPFPCNLSLSPDQKDWLLDRENKAGTIREAIAFVIAIEKALNRPCNAADLQNIVEVCRVAGDRLPIVPFLIQ